MNTEENLDHLPAIYINLHCPAGAIGIVKPKTPIQTFSTAPVIASEPSNLAYKPRYQPMTLKTYPQKIRRCMTAVKPMRWCRLARD